jgi:hypothetical protein
MTAVFEYSPSAIESMFQYFGGMLYLQEQKQLTWYGHVQRMAAERLPRIALRWMPEQRQHKGDRRKTG